MLRCTLIPGATVTLPFIFLCLHLSTRTRVHASTTRTQDPGASSCQQGRGAGKEGIFFYYQTHNEELQREKTQIAIRKAFVAAGITPFQDGKWKLYVQSSFMTKGAPAACDILHQVFKLQEKKAISVYLLKCGLDDQDPEDWDDADVLLGEGLNLEGLVMPDVDGLTSDEEAGEGEKGDESEEEEEMEEVTHLRVPSPILTEDEEEVEDEEGGEEEMARGEGGARACKRRRH